MNKDKQREIISLIWRAQSQLKNLEWAIEENEKVPEDLMDYVNMTDQHLNEIESLLNNLNQ